MTWIKALSVKRGHRLEKLAVQNGVALWEASDDGSSSDDGDSGKSVRTLLPLIADMGQCPCLWLSP